MAKVIYDSDIDEGVLKSKKIAIIGYGNQGHAHALNLRDSGYDVRVGLPDDPYKEIALKDGVIVKTVAEAVAEADLVSILIPDEVQKTVYDLEIAKGLKKGNTLLFAHGFNIHFSQIVPPKDVDVIMVAPKSPGRLVRQQYIEGKGVPAIAAVYQDYTKSAYNIALAYAKGIGCAKAGVIETTFKEETETDLFGEQAVLCGGVTELIKAGFDTLVEAGYQPEIAYFECLNELKLIVDLIYDRGISGMRKAVSNTAEYGDITVGKKIINKQTREIMKEVLSDVQSGKFAKEWILESQSGAPMFNALRKIEAEHLIEKIGPMLRDMMSWTRNS